MFKYNHCGEKKKTQISIENRNYLDQQKIQCSILQTFTKKAFKQQCIGQYSTKVREDSGDMLSHKQEIVSSSLIGPCVFKYDYCRAKRKHKFTYRTENILHQQNSNAVYFRHSQNSLQKPLCIGQYSKKVRESDGEQSGLGKGSYTSKDQQKSRSQKLGLVNFQGSKLSTGIQEYLFQYQSNFLKLLPYSTDMHQKISRDSSFLDDMVRSLYRGNRNSQTLV